MKKLLVTLLSLFVVAFMYGQKVVVNSDITTNTTWTANNTYELTAYVYVTNNATLTIEPGTVIMGDSATKGALIITRGAKIYAKGTPEKPIVFTSNQPAGSRKRGSWGGLIILGNAKINAASGTAVLEGGLDATKGQYGGTNDQDSSGVLQYVRIEYAGVPFVPNQELNSLTLGGVGSKTVIDHIMVTEANDDSYEWFGGTVNAKYIIANRGWDDDFDTDFGFTGKVQFGVAYRDPSIADVSGSTSFESDNDGGGTTATPKTAPVFSNITVIGPKQTSSTTVNPQFTRAAHLRRNTATSIFNSVMTGYPQQGVYIDGSAAAANAAGTSGDSLFVRNVTFAGFPDGRNIWTNAAGFDANAWGFGAGTGNDSLANSSDIMLNNQTSFTAPDFRPATGSPLLNKASFNYNKLKDPFFTTTTYRGAFSTNDTWTDCWCKWEPQTEDYTKAVDYTAVANFTAVVNNATVTVTNTSANATTYTWNFGDPNSTADEFTTQNPAPYSYTANGTYNITLTVRNGNCPPKTIQKTVQVTSFTSPTVVVAGDITTNTTWTNDKIYELKNVVYVTNNATLTIEPGTLVKGDSATKGTLVVTKGSKLMAVGTKFQPIVFTSNQPAGSRTRGSWGGIVLLGNATINTPGGTSVIEGGLDPVKGSYGGNNDADNSGHLEYVRIEYAGVPFQPNQELNSLTMGGVGSGTIINHIQVTEANDDSYEWFGGTVNGKYLIANRGWDDDFDADFGFRGKIQFGVALRDPQVADVSGSTSFESDNDGGGTTATPKTAVVFSNMTIIGPIATAGQTIHPNFTRAAHLRRNTEASIFNSIIAGYPTGLFIDGSASAANASNGSLAFKNNLMAGMSVRNWQGNSTLDVATWANTVGFNNDSAALPTGLMLADPYNFNRPNFEPQAGSPALGNASFADAKLAGMTTTTYRGAFAADDEWTDCWTRWNPQGELYNSAILYEKATAQGTVQGTGGLAYQFSNTSVNAESYLWDFGTGVTDTSKNPAYIFPTGGTYNVKLKALSGCGNDSTVIQVVIVSAPEVARSIEARVYPNPAQNVVNVEFNMEISEAVTVNVMDITGKTVITAYETESAFGSQSVSINTQEFAGGIYFVRISTPSALGNHKVIIIK